MEEISMRSVLCILCLLVLVGAAFAQSDRGTITGTISDPTGAMIGGANIVAKNSQTGTEYQTASTATGNFTLAQLPIGTYELSATSPGFKKYVRPGIIVSVAQIMRIDVNLEVGQISELVTVEAESPLLKTESGELSHNINYDRVDSIPLLTIGGSSGFGNIRNPLQVVTLLPGATFTNDIQLRINGMPSSSHTIRIEGQDATSGMWREINQTNQSGLDAIQEVSIQTSNFAAEYGQAGGGYFNYTMKSGTNRIHGSAYDYNVNEAYNAGTPNTNDGTGAHIKNRQRRNDYGFTFGGPVYIPKLYDGRDKTFFFFTFEQFRETLNYADGAAFYTVPTDAYRAGDFSAALGTSPTPLKIAGKVAQDPLGRTLYQNEIFNPFKTYTGPNGSTLRDPVYSCDGKTMNVICTDPGSPYYIGQQFDPVALKVQNALPGPRGVNAGLLINNYAVPAYSNFSHRTIPTVKIDHNLSSRVKLSGFFSENIAHSPGNNGLNDFVWFSGTPTNNHSYTSRINVDATLRPTLLFHVGIGYMYTTTPAQPKTFDQSALGFTNKFVAPIYPNINPGTGAGSTGGVSFGFFNTIGPAYPAPIQEDIKPTANTSLTWVKGNHTIKAGAELMLEGLPITNYSRAGGILNFSAQQTAIPWENGIGLNSTTGFPYASFLLGQTSSINYSQITDTRLGNHALGMYLQDSWKVTRRLTMDYGLRYDLQTLLREQYGRMQNANFGEINPLIVPAGASQGLPGKMDYEATCNCRFGQTYKFAFGPRLGLAYQINTKTVFRAGAGVMYGTSPNNAMLTLSVADWYQMFPASYGMAATTLQSGNPAPNLVWPDFSDHYPAETLPGVRPPAAPFISIADNTGRPPRIFQWSIGLQRELARNLALEVSYVGNRGAWWTAPILSALNYNGLTPAGLKAERMYGDTTGIDITDPKQAVLLTTPIAYAVNGVMVPNPSIAAKFPVLANITNTGTPARATVDAVYKGFPATYTLGQALRQYPQWLGVPPFLGPPMGDTWYDSLQAKLTKRFSHGLDLQTAFTWQKELVLGTNSDTSYFTPGTVRVNDVYDRMSNKEISSLSKPFMLVISFNYTTPKFGASNTGLHMLSWLTRDWIVGGVLRYQSGDLIPTPTSNNGLFAQLMRTDNPGGWGGYGTYWNRVPGQPLFLVDPNSNNWDPTRQLVLNPAAWTDVPTGTFSNSAPYYNDYRWRRQPSESLSLGRQFPIGRKEFPATLSIRIELNNVFNRFYRSAPTPSATSTVNPATPTANYNPGGALSAGYGFVNTFNGAGAIPRSGQIVARINF
jgi:hypothetical protein